MLVVSPLEFRFLRSLGVPPKSASVEDLRLGLTAFTVSSSIVEPVKLSAAGRMIRLLPSMASRLMDCHMKSKSFCCCCSTAAIARITLDRMRKSRRTLMLSNVARDFSMMAANAVDEAAMRFVTDFEVSRFWWLVCFTSLVEMARSLPANWSESTMAITSSGLADSHVRSTRSSHTGSSVRCWVKVRVWRYLKLSAPLTTAATNGSEVLSSPMGMLCALCTVIIRMRVVVVLSLLWRKRDIAGCFMSRIGMLTLEG
mmetsp:Transcript_34351/g.65629  ORF Transcript_34351/g.65629 Transcript_34351/m.65629 type:complete len:256 (-) Transcript_34351:705-1472(-)